MAEDLAKGRKGPQAQRDAEKPEEVAGPGEGQGAAAEQSQALFPPSFSVSEIKNKQRRHFMFLRWKQQQRKVRGEKRSSRLAFIRLGDAFLL